MSTEETPSEKDFAVMIGLACDVFTYLDVHGIEASRLLAIAADHWGVNESVASVLAWVTDYLYSEDGVALDGEMILRQFFEDTDD